MEMKIKDFGKVIWELAAESRKNGRDSGSGVGVGLDLFLSNVRAGKAVEVDVPGVDWAALQERWNGMTDREQTAFIAAFHRALDQHYESLCEAYREEDWETFEGLLDTAQGDEEA